MNVNAFFLGVLVGVALLAILLGSIGVYANIPQQAVIDHQCARWNPSSGKFEWLKENGTKK